MQQPGYNAAIYCRLSRDDGNEESQSIASQKEVLTKYIKDFLSTEVFLPKVPSAVAI